MSNNFLIVTCEDHVNYQYFAKFKKIGVERGCIDIINHNEVLDYAISDFDNVLDEEIDVIKDKAISFQQLSCDKDFLDGEEAIKLAQEHGADKIVLVAKPTKRYDMNFSLIHLVQKYKIQVINKDSCLFLIKKGSMNLHFDQFQGYTFVTFYPLTDCTISISGLKYAADNLTLAAHTLGAYSNAFILYQDGVVTTDADLICIMTR
jgi:thiamine pyrophosphokinase